MSLRLNISDNWLSARASLKLRRSIAFSACASSLPSLA
jgi:hypothetical protein